MTVAVAFLAGGRLYVKDGADAPQAFDSKFGQTVRDRAVRSAQKNAWKMSGTGAQAREAAVLRIAITGVSRAAQPGLLLYVLDTDDIVGLFSLDPATGEEKRLFHSNERHLRFPSGRPGQDRVVCSVVSEGGTSNLAVMNADGSDLREITEGDSLDLAPSWAPEGPRIVYQTAGLGRDRQGRLVGMSPFSVQLLDLRTGDIEPLLEDARFDFLGPRVASDGTVYAIRRYTGKPLSTSGGARQKLVRRRPGGEPEEIASAILSFDLADDGSVVCSNGSAIDQIAPDGRRETLWKGELVEQVVAI